jgi:hypothetical protein
MTLTSAIQVLENRPPVQPSGVRIPPSYMNPELIVDPNPCTCCVCGDVALLKWPVAGTVKGFCKAHKSEAEAAAMQTMRREDALYARVNRDITEAGQ